jgi:hypothetical protein
LPREAIDTRFYEGMFHVSDIFPSVLSSLTNFMRCPHIRRMMPHRNGDNTCISPKSCDRKGRGMGLYSTNLCTRKFSTALVFHKHAWVFRLTCETLLVHFTSDTESGFIVARCTNVGRWRLVGKETGPFIYWN